MVSGRDDVTSKGNTFRRIEVLSGPEQRRRWTVEEKLAIVEESFATPLSISEVARRHGLNRNQLFQWRRQFRTGDLAGGMAPADFVPVVTWAAEAMDTPAAATPTERCGLIEVIVGSMTVRVPPMVDAAVLGRVLAVVKGLA